MHFGIDVGGTKTEFAVFDENFERVHSCRVSTPRDDYEQYLQTLKSLIKRGDEEFGGRNTIGVGITGVLDRQGCSLSVNVPCTNGNNVERDLAEIIGRPVRCINDVRAFALSEAQGGAAEGFRTMVGVILGTGSASGYCLDGFPVLGINGVAGEWGHLPIDVRLATEFDLPVYDCPCGLSACQELYVSGQGLARLAEHFSGEALDSLTCVSRMRSGDAPASRAFGVWLECVSAVVSQLVLHINPEVIVIGGGMSKIEEIYTLLPEAVSGKLLKGVPTPPILQAKFGDDSGVRGAAIVGAQD